MSELTSTSTVKRAYLPKGCARRLARKLGVTESYVRLIHTGKRSLRTDLAQEVKRSLLQEIELEERKLKELTTRSPKKRQIE